ncbi:MAG TPA: hypothetical protein VFM18_10075 [Methanosarcina sp.]|nr:hypothetical protein [Methanosarcina sp.]
MTAGPLTYNVPSNLTTPFDANKLNANQPVAGQMANGWLDNSDTIKADLGQNYLHNAHTSLLWAMQQLGICLPFNPDGLGHSLVATPKGGIVSLKDSVTGVTQFYVAQNAMAIGYVDPSTDPTNWTYINFPTLAKFVPVYADATGTSDAITGTYTVIYPVLQDGTPLEIGIVTPNTTTAPTFTPTLNGSVQTTRTIFKMVGNVAVALEVGDLQGVASLRYDLPNTRWILINPASASVTSTSDATFADNSPKPVSSNWVRGAMSAIATAAGFATSMAANGYIKFPSWLGGWVVQWGSGNTITINFPVAFPTAVYQILPQVNWNSTGAAASSQYTAIVSSTTTNFTLGLASSALPGTLTFIAIGR